MATEQRREREMAAAKDVEKEETLEDPNFSAVTSSKNCRKQKNHNNNNKK